MDFKLSKIQETLEKSRKVLMESMELRPTTTKSSFMDRFNYCRYSNPRRPDSRTEVSSIYTRNPTENEKSSTSFTTNALGNDYLPINHHSIELERKKIQLENEILMKKLQNTKERYFGVEKSNHVSRNMTPTPVKASDIVYDVEINKKYSENSFEKIRMPRDSENRDELSDKQMKSAKRKELDKENEKKSVKKYKKIVEDLEKKLKCVTKKYENLKNLEKNNLNRNPSTLRNGSKTRNKSKKKVKRDKSCASYRNCFK
jgi:hypothetical protein